MPDFLETTVDKFIFKVGTDRLYSQAGIWVLAEAGGLRLGVTDYQQQLNGDVAFVHLKPVGTLLAVDQEFAEVCYVPDEAARKKDAGTYRFIAIREPLRQLELPGAESKPEQLPFPTMDFGPAQRYKLSGVLTNRQEPADQVIRWHRQRCGKSEQVHAVPKNDLGGGTIPSGCFGANASWRAIVTIAYNMLTIMSDWSWEAAGSAGG